MCFVIDNILYHNIEYNDYKIRTVNYKENTMAALLIM